MSEKSTQKTDKSARGFKVIDAKQGIIELWDSLHELPRRWQISDQAKPGVAILMETVEKEGQIIREKNLKEHFEKMSPEEREQVIVRVQKNAHKQLAIMASYCEPLDEVPELLDNKIEFLAACLTNEKDAMRISAFFLMRSVTATTSQEGLKQEMEQLIKSL